MDEARCWLAQPEQWQPLFRRWHAERPGDTRLDAWPQEGGQAVLALTLGAGCASDESGGSSPAFRLLAAVPHGHEPAPTAAAVDAACQLLRGVHLDGSPSALPGAEILRRARITLVPDANPQGRARAPVPCWDGAVDNEAFLKVAFGVAADGGRFGRYPEWRLDDHHPRSVGLVYEHLGAGEYAEPNTSRRSTYARATDALFARERYTHLLEMHQHEGAEAALLPAGFDALGEDDRRRTRDWAARLLAAWRAVGAEPQATPHIPYRGQPRQQQFLAFWAGRCPGMLRLTSEVRNNRLNGSGEPTPLARQLRTALAALEATLLLALP